MGVRDLYERACDGAAYQPGPPCHRHARALLHRAGIYAHAILAVSYDAIAYQNAGEQPMTAWLTRCGQWMEIRTEAGLPAEPAAGLPLRWQGPAEA